jgi:hypothetical protein
MIERHVRRLLLLGVLLVIVGSRRGIDTAMAVALSLAVMEVDAAAGGPNRPTADRRRHR